MTDGTRRKTIAARGGGFDSVCFDDEASKLLRRAAFDAVRAVAGALDTSTPLKGDSTEYDWRGVVDKGRHLEHVHAYYGPSKGEALEAHVDEGVLVAMVAGAGGSRDGMDAHARFLCSSSNHGALKISEKVLSLTGAD